MTDLLMRLESLSVLIDCCYGMSIRIQTDFPDHDWFHLMGVQGHILAQRLKVDDIIKHLKGAKK